MPVPSDPFNFTNGAVADAEQVDARFAPLYAALDGALDHTNAAVPKGLFFAYRSAAMSLPNNNRIEFDEERFDVSNWLDPTMGRFAPKVAGYYQLSWCARLAVTGATFNVLTVLNKNDLAHANGAALRATPTSAVGSTGSAVVQANGTTDYFDVRLVHDYAGTVGIEPGSAATFFCGHLIGRS